MDLNIVVLCGRLTTMPDWRVFDSGTRMVRLLLTVHSDRPRRRIDVVPVTLWDPDDESLDGVFEPGTWLWVTGAVQRTFSHGPDERGSRLEVVAHQVARRHEEWSATGGSLEP